MTDRSPRPLRKRVLVLQGCLVVALTPLVVSLGLLAIFPHPHIDDWSQDWAELSAFSSDGQLVAVPVGPKQLTRVGNQSAFSRSQLAIYRMADGQAPEVMPVTLAVGAAWSPDQILLSVPSADRKLRLYRSADGELLHTLDAKVKHNSRLLFSADGHLLLTGGDDHRARVWQLPEGRLLGTYKTDTTTKVVLSPDGRLLAAEVDSGEVAIWTIADGQEWQRLAERNVGALAFSPDGHYLALSSSYTAYGPNTRVDREEVHLWQLTPQGPIRTQVLRTSDSITNVAFSPDGQYVVAGGAAATQGMDWGLQDVLPIIRQVRIWRVRDGQLVQQLDLPYHSITRLAFTPDGRTLLVAGVGREWEGRISRWRVQPRHPFWGWLAPLSTLGALLSWAVWRLRRHGAQKLTNQETKELRQQEPP